MNVFIVRDGKIITPGVDQDILEGITRDSVIVIAKELKYEVEVRAIDKSELLIADEVFLTGTAAKITPVKKIENYTLPKERPVIEKLSTKLNLINECEFPEYDSWITKVDLI
jgi:branched-chain amino acid aminotransferase